MENATVTAFGGVEIEVNLLDGSAERVKVRQLPLEDMPHYAQVANDEVSCIALFCGKPIAWVKTLNMDSQESILEKGEEINLGPLTRFAERASRRMEKLMVRLPESAIKKAMSTLPNSSPGSPPPRV